MDQLKANVKKNQGMVRKPSPITIESKGYERINEKMEKVCDKIREKYKLMTH